jgi:hypothetical protein
MKPRQLILVRFMDQGFVLPTDCQSRHFAAIELVMVTTNGKSWLAGCMGTLINQLWMATRIKYHSQYPVRRILALREFSSKTPPWRVFIAIAVTPLPCLMVMLSFEAVTLDPPNPEAGRNLKFYAREHMTYYAFTVCLLQQLSTQVGPSLPISAAQIVWIALCVVTANVGFSYLAATVVGFPVPFTMQLSGVTYFILKASALGYLWRTQLRANIGLLKDITTGWFFIVGQYVLIIVYPVYYYAFMNIPDSAGPRLAFLSLLPLLKLGSRLLFARVIQKNYGGDELVPQQIVFTPDVIGSLFVAFCMQYRPSLLVASCIAGTTVATEVLSFRDIRSTGREIDEVKRQIDQKRQQVRTASAQGLCLGNEICMTKANILDEVAEIIGRYNTNTIEEVTARVRGRLTKTRSASKFLSSRVQPSTPAPYCLANQQLTPQLSPAAMAAVGIRVAPPTVAKHGRALVTESNLVKASSKVKLEQLELKYVRVVMKMLYMAEFTVLAEYIEIVIPLLYCTYLMI